jgi:hypothetical protein
MLAKSRQLSLRQGGSSLLSMPRLIAEFGNVLLVVADHVAANFAIECAAAKVEQLVIFGDSLGHCASWHGHAHAVSYDDRLGARGPMVGDECITVPAHGDAVAALRDQATEPHFAIVALDGVVKKL